MTEVCSYYLYKVNGSLVWVEAYSELQAMKVLRIKKVVSKEIRPMKVSETKPPRYIRAGAKAKKKASNTKKVTKPKVEQGLYNFPRPETLYRCNCGRDVPAGTCHLSKDLPLEFLVPSIPED